MPHKVIMNSGRVYTIHEYEEKTYANNWVYFRDEYEDTIIGLCKSNIEAEIFHDDDSWEVGRVNSNS